jgi:hypothetical protein
MTFGNLEPCSPQLPQGEGSGRVREQRARICGCARGKVTQSQPEDTDDEDNVSAISLPVSLGDAFGVGGCGRAVANHSKCPRRPRREEARACFLPYHAGHTMMRRNLLIHCAVHCLRHPRQRLWHSRGARLNSWAWAIPWRKRVCLGVTCCRVFCGT